jgi:peptidyl-prolyl cis-trans isomerase SurA
MRNLLTAVLLLVITSAKAQTIFTYGTNSVSKNEFWRAYTKNNSGEVNEKSIREYLDLYIRFKLKVQAAKDLKLDTLPNITSDVAGFRAQLIEQYMRQMSNNKELIAEALKRAKEELELSHIFIAYNNDSASAKTQIEKAYKELQTGADFGKTANTFSNNDYVKYNNGYIGFITVLSLPYEMENIVYGLTPGSYSKPVAGVKGYHIFKLISKRATAGKMKAAQILIALPKDADPDQRTAAKNLVDSVYYWITNGMKFEDAARMYSADKFSYSTGGVMPEFTFTSYDAAFTKQAFALQKDNDISKPFLTSMGWHIIQRISLTPLKTDIDDPAVYEEWNAKVSNDTRIMIAIAKMKEQLKQICGYKAMPYNEQQLWTLTDTMLKAKDYVPFFKANKAKVLFQLKAKTISVSDWLQYAKSQRSIPEVNSKKEYKNLLKQFTEETAEQYYKDRMELMNEDFKYQVKEFTEGSLLFEIMERKIWSKAPADSAGLINYYNSNKSKYKWLPSAGAIIYNCSDSAVAGEVLRMMKENPTRRWKEVMDLMGGKALADSGRFEYAQLPIKNITDIKPGEFTPVITNTNDGSSSFCYIIKTFVGNDQRTYDEAKGMVINDYQLLLEEQWINQLKKKYPVKVNEVVAKGLK